MAGELIINPFDDAGYNMATMTQAVNKIANQYGRVRAMNIFTPDPVRARQIIIEEMNGLLTLLKSQAVGAPPPQKNMARLKCDPS